MTLVLACAAAAVSYADAAEPEAPERTAAEEIAHWATLPADGPEGRPLPLTGSWNIGRWYQQPWKGWGGGGDHTRKPGVDTPKPRAWDPTYFTELIEQGRHVLPTFPDPMTRGAPEGELVRLGVSFEPALEYCARHKLPIAFRDWNLADVVAQHEKHKEGGYSNDQTARFIKDGKQLGRKASPIGDIERWREFGRAWGGSGFIKAMAEIYPDPPLIVYLNNNEAGKVRVGDLNDSATRFVTRHGADVSKEEKAEILHEGYRERYHATFDAAREAAPEGWADAMTYVAYNAFPWPKLRHETPLHVEDPADLPQQFHEWTYFDGAIPENYMNNWQVGRGKTDFSSWSPQAEATTYYPMSQAVFEADPDYYFAMIGWEGGVPGRSGSPPNAYATGDFGGGAVKKWDFDRYEGMVQFGLWAARPRVLREFRGGATRDAYYQKTWEVYLDIVDRVWKTPDLQPFWKYGELVENPEIIWQPSNQGAQLKRWYLLHSDVNPPADTWPQIWKSSSIKLRVFPMAIELGEAPERRWLLYAHAPLGAVAQAPITLPGYGEVTVDVSRSGSFYIVDEATGEVTCPHWGGPAELTLTPEHRFVDQRNFVEVTPRLIAPAGAGIRSYVWSVNAEQLGETARLAPRSIELTADGANTVRVGATAADGQEIVGETTVWFGEAPDEAVVYDVPLDRASTWQGPWRVLGDEFPGTLQTYRLLPNRGAASDPVLHGGRFVDDAERGRVLEVGPGEGLWCERTSRTVNSASGHPNKTVSFRFKTGDVTARQVLYSEGHANAGFNVYVEGGKLHAGGWGVKAKFGSWSGDWMSAEGVQADRWHHVALVLADATDAVEPDKLTLYLDGEKVASGPAKRLPKHHSAPRLGVARSTRFGDGTTGGGTFVGRLADFRLVNAAVPPR
ncbi:MAG: LamG-like jellyroll fold domain-containing protein [Planctomycetota bacterium]